MSTAPKTKAKLPLPAESSRSPYLQRRGCFRISGAQLRRDAEALQSVIFAKVLVTHLDYDPAQDVIMYYACSDHFERVPDGMPAPEYNFAITRENDTTKLVRVEKL